MPARKLDGIFCLEGEWNTDLSARESVRPLLELLENLKIAKAIHRDIATRPELEYYLQKWRLKKYQDYKILYLAGHGASSSLQLGQDKISLTDLSSLLKGACGKRVIYFGSCSVLGIGDDQIKALARTTGAKAVVGYSKEIDWLDAAAFELLLLERLVRGNRSDAFFNHLVRDHGKLAADLGLVVGTAKAVMHASAG